MYYNSLRDARKILTCPEEILFVITKIPKGLI
jgi:hypothetical protein